MKNLTATLSILILFSACGSRGYMPATTEGFAPIYSQDASTLKTIKAGPARTTVNAGKMYTVGNLLFQVEQDSGIHVINYANPSSPQKRGFIRSMMCKELAVKNGLIYTNNLSDLVVIDINDLSGVREVGRTPDVFPNLSLQYPPKDGNPFQPIYFECPDPKKGYVVGWKKQTIKNPKCWR
ncbi:MAG TPA: hypothetical protein VF144_18625 [Chitinophagaceae bacterium]